MGINLLQLRSRLRPLLKAAVPFAYGVMLHGRSKDAAHKMTNPKSILLLNGAHIGDVVIASSVIPILRSAYPTAMIGFVTGSWSEMVVKNHPDVAYTHTIDHWRLNRGSSSFLEKMLRYRRTRHVALKEIRKIKYDVAISLYTVFPDFLDLSWAAKIPVRIGFQQSFLASLATDLVDETKSLFVSQGARLAEPLRALPIDPVHFQKRRSTLPPSDIASIQEVCSILKVTNLDDAHYIIIHMGAGAASKMLPVSFWRELAEKLSPRHTLLFTGRGEQEGEDIAAAMRGLKNCINACGHLSLNGFVAAVRHAEVLYGVDSMAGHIAGTLGTKCVVVYGGTVGVARWRPEGENVVVFTNHVPCAPCFRPQGCEAMTCMQAIRPIDLVRLDQ